jgi:hypothetical protein
MRKVLLVFALLAPSCAGAQQSTVNIPLTLADQATIIPLLCEAALYGFRMRFQDFCDLAKVKLPEALKAERDAAEKAKESAGEEKKP